MLRRRKMSKLANRLTAGPGAMSQALGITTKLNSHSLLGDKIWIEDRGIKISPRKIQASPRVGVAYAEECADWPLRFRIRDNPWVSKAK